MRLIRDILKEHQALGKPSVSCEFFPAKTPEGEKALLEKIVPRLKEVNPAFFSVTYGAGGSTRDKTLGIVDVIQSEYGVPTMAHLTCVGSAREDISRFLEDANSSGISNILAQCCGSLWPCADLSGLYYSYGPDGWAQTYLAGLVLGVAIHVLSKGVGN